jgi:hypothetical protein
VSDSSSRNNAAPLSDATVSGPIWVFTDQTRDIKQVLFYVDDDDRNGSPYLRERHAPWELAGGDAFDTTKLTDGTHSITAVITHDNGSTDVVQSSFNVLNDAADTAPERPEAPESAPANGDTILDVTFDDAKLGKATAAGIRSAFGHVHTSKASKYANLEFVRENGNRFLRSHNPAGEYGGANLQMKLPREADEAILKYRMRFKDNFDFSKGGKLPGLAGVAPGSDLAAAAGGGAPDGDDAWSARGMWYSDKAYKSMSPGEAVQYLYYPDMPGKYGQILRYGLAYPRGEWVEVSSHIVMNTPGKKNGSITISVDGREVARRTGMRFRTTRDLSIDRIFFATFRGGSGSDWMSNRHGWIDFDNIQVVIPD